MDPVEATAVYQAQHARLLALVKSTLERQWVGLGNYDQADIDRWLSQALPIVHAAQTQVGSLLDAYVSTLLGTSPAGVVDLTGLRAGTVPEATYRRPFITLWTELNAGKSFGEASAAARRRVGALGQMDTQLAQREAMGQLASTDRRIRGYRRTLSGGSCVFCASVSTRRYTVSDLMPLHDHCDCGVSPIYGSSDPGAVVNKRLLERLKARGPDYWKQNGYVDADGNPLDPTRAPGSRTTAVESHDELGPYLTPA